MVILCVGLYEIHSLNSEKNDPVALYPGAFCSDSWSFICCFYENSPPLGSVRVQEYGLVPVITYCSYIKFFLKNDDSDDDETAIETTPQCLEANVNLCIQFLRFLDVL